MDPHPNQHQLFNHLHPENQTVKQHSLLTSACNHSLLTNCHALVASATVGFATTRNTTELLRNWFVFLASLHPTCSGKSALLFRSSPRLISIGQLHVLPRFHLRPINDIVYVEPQWRSYLRESFTLRCLQRLSRPYVATQLCPWQDNWCTRGMSIPVLSY